MLRQTVFFLYLCAISIAGYGADIYKWVDEKGVTHFGDTPPDASRIKPKKLDLIVHEPTNAERRDADAKAARDKARSAIPEEPSTAPQVVTMPSPPPRSMSAQDQYELNMKKYRESQDCFGPYITAGGGIKAEAFEHCTDMKEPKRP